ncbi:MAG TPA: hypothetical protein ENK47_00730 [Euryarchaeota archaeon]|nr:hypothetical protein [Euryarchaeota archaeon]
MSPSIFKRGGTSSVKLKTASRAEINQYAQILAGQGFQLFGTPIEYRQMMTTDQLRESAKGYAYQNGCHLVVEVNDPNPMVNPYNPYKYYLFKFSGSGQPPDPMNPPSQGGGYPQQQPQGQTFAQFTCPYCRNSFTSYVKPGKNVLTCPSCKRQSQVEIPAADVGLQMDQGPGASHVQAAMSAIKLKSSYNTYDEMLMDCLEALGKILMIEGNPLPFEDTGEFLYPFIRMKSAAYQHVGFRNMDMILLKEATHDYKIMGSEQHSQSQANVNPHRDDLFAIKVLGGINYLVLEEFKRLEDEQKQLIINAFYEFLTRYVGVE